MVGGFGGRAPAHNSLVRELSELSRNEIASDTHEQVSYAHINNLKSQKNLRKFENVEKTSGFSTNNWKIWKINLMKNKLKYQFLEMKKPDFIKMFIKIGPKGIFL